MKYFPVILIPLYLFLVSCKDRLKVPGDKIQIINRLDLSSYRPAVYQGSGGVNQKPLWVRWEIKPDQIDFITKNDKIMEGLFESSSSKSTADNLSKGIYAYGKIKPNAWIPASYDIYKGYSGDRKSLGVYRSDKTNDLIFVYRISR